jgi:hypothetical protein
MEFRLIYEGPLPAQSGSNARLDEKHCIRKEMHKQLRNLWYVQAPLVGFATRKTILDDAATGEHREWTTLDEITQKYKHSGFNFVPLVGRHFGLACSLDILFLRRENPGAVITQGGDLDNRIKLLFDALRMPKDAGEIPNGTVPDVNEQDYFFCLLEDDHLITEFTVASDRLLAPLRTGDNQNDVYLVIKVKTKVADHRSTYIEFLA